MECVIPTKEREIYNNEFQHILSQYLALLVPRPALEVQKWRIFLSNNSWNEGLGMRLVDGSV